MMINTCTYNIEKSQQYSSCEDDKLRKSIASDKHLAREKRNKRKSKIFLKNTNTSSDESICKNDDEISIDSKHITRTGKLFKESDSINPINASHNYTLELFKSLSVDDYQAGNIDLDIKLSRYLNEICSEINSNEEKNNDYKKLSYSQKFKERVSNFNEYYPSKRFKI